MTDYGTNEQPFGNNQDKISKLEKDVDHVSNQMRENMKKALERRENLEQAGQNSEALRDASTLYFASAVRVKRKYWWKNVKMWIIIVGTALVIIAIIAIIIYTQTKSDAPSPKPVTYKP